MSLHLVFSNRGWLACAPRLGEQDVIVLIGDGVYQQGKVSEAHVIDQDLTIRGLKAAQPAQVIDQAALVQLTTAHHPIVSWN